MTGDTPKKFAIGTPSWLTQVSREAEVIQLPMWPEPKRGTPNAFLRSALFAAVQGNKRRWMKEEIIGSTKDVVVKYTGQQLTQADLDVWDTLVHLARMHPLGTECAFTAHGLLKALGRNTGKSDHAWLHSTIIRLQACSVQILHDGKQYFGSLIVEGAKDTETRAYRVILNPKLFPLFSENTWTQLDWEQRQQLTKQPLAQALHGYWSTHRFPKPVHVPTLHRITGSGNKSMRDFRYKLKIALDVLQGIGFFAAWKIDEADLVHVTRPTPQLPPSLRG
jgi:hypothetical protein